MLLEFRRPTASCILRLAWSHRACSSAWLSRLRSTDVLCERIESVDAKRREGHGDDWRLRGRQATATASIAMSYDPNEEHLDAMSEGFRDADDRTRYRRWRRERELEDRRMQPEEVQRKATDRMDDIKTNPTDGSSIGIYLLRDGREDRRPIGWTADKSWAKEWANQVDGRGWTTLLEVKRSLIKQKPNKTSCPTN